MGEFKLKFDPQVTAWRKTLPPTQRALFDGAVNLLRESGPALGNGKVKRIKSSQYHNMKELRVNNRSIRVLFAFDRERTGVLLVGGDKQGDWNGWYRKNVKAADSKFAAHLRSRGQDPPGGRSNDGRQR